MPRRVTQLFPPCQRMDSLVNTCRGVVTGLGTRHSDGQTQSVKRERDRERSAPCIAVRAGLAPVSHLRVLCASFGLDVTLQLWGGMLIPSQQPTRRPPPMSWRGAVTRGLPNEMARTASLVCAFPNHGPGALCCPPTHARVRQPRQCKRLGDHRHDRARRGGGLSGVQGT